MNEILREFGIVLGKLKNIYADEYNCNPYYLEIHIDNDNNITIIDTLEKGEYCECFRDWVDTDEN